MSQSTNESLVSNLPDRGGLPLDGDAITAEEYQRIMRRIDINIDDSGTPVSAFNSSI